MPDTDSLAVVTDDPSPTPPIDETTSAPPIDETTSATTSAPPAPVSDEGYRQLRAAAILASLDGEPDPGDHSDAEARLARALWMTETEGTSAPTWERLKVQQYRAMVSHARRFIVADSHAARLARVILGL